MNWSKASIAERKALYRAIRETISEGRTNWAVLYEEVLGEEFAPGIDYEANFRAGRIARPKAASFYSWLSDNVPDRAAALVAELHSGLPATENTLWADFVHEHGEHGEHADVSIIRVKRHGLGIVQPAEQQALWPYKIGLGDHFCFELTSPFSGFALGLQCVNGSWYRMPLVPGDMLVPIGAGKNTLPISSDGTVLPLSENEDAGFHSFIFMLTKQRFEDLPDISQRDAALSDGTLAMIARYFEGEPVSDWQLQRLNVIFALAAS